LVFGIIAGVLIGVWAMYTMLGDKSDAQTAIAEIQMIKKAAHEYKYAPGKQNKYGGVGMDLTQLQPYLGQSGIANSQNIFGTAVTLVAANTERDLDVTYDGVRDLDICRQILNHFGTVTDATRMTGTPPVTTGYVHIALGGTISGYVGDPSETITGCEEKTGGGYTLNIRID
jgi:hypothetical protein